MAGRMNAGVVAAMLAAVSGGPALVSGAASPAPYPFRRAATHRFGGGPQTQWRNPKRAEKKATGLHGRQWVKHRKATQRARRAAEQQQ